MKNLKYSDCLKQQTYTLLMMALVYWTISLIVTFYRFRSFNNPDQLPVKFFIPFAIGYITIGAFLQWYYPQSKDA